MTKERVKEDLFLLINGFMKENGNRDSSMEKDHIRNHHQQNSKKEFGNMEKE